MNIEHLLDERKRLRFLHQERIRFKVTTLLDWLADVEKQIASLILESLAHLHKRDIPGAPWMVAEAVAGFALLATDPRYAEDSTLVWHYADGIVIPSVPTERWHIDVKNRIAELAGSLDAVLLKLQQTGATAA